MRAAAAAPVAYHQRLPQPRFRKLAQWIVQQRDVADRHERLHGVRDQWVQALVLAAGQHDGDDHAAASPGPASPCSCSANDAAGAPPAGSSEASHTRTGVSRDADAVESVVALTRAGKARRSDAAVAALGWRRRPLPQRPVPLHGSALGLGGVGAWNGQRAVPHCCSLL
eukprot:354234-Chlamydomonas_euryale.AAC.20